MVATVEEEGFTAFDAGGASLLAPGVRQPLLLPDAQEEDRAARIAKGAARDRERASAVLVLCHQWQPDIVVCDEADLGVVVAAERLGLPYASVQSTASGSVVPSGVVAEQANELRVEHGLPPDPGLEMLRRYLVLVPFPPGFRDPGSPLPPTAHALRHVSPDLTAGRERIPVARLGLRQRAGVCDAGDDLQPGVGRSLRAHRRGRARPARRCRRDRGPRARPGGARPPACQRPRRALHPPGTAPAALPPGRVPWRVWQRDRRPGPRPADGRHPDRGRSTAQRPTLQRPPCRPRGPRAGGDSGPRASGRPPMCSRTQPIG